LSRHHDLHRSFVVCRFCHLSTGFVDVRGWSRWAGLRDAVLAGPAAVSGAGLGEVERAGLLERLVACGDVERALAGAGHLDGRRPDSPSH
jgi:hypothetical protein